MKREYYYEEGTESYIEITETLEEFHKIGIAFNKFDLTEQKNIYIKTFNTDELEDKFLKEVSEEEYYTKLIDYLYPELVLKNLENVFKKTKIFQNKECLNRLIKKISNDFKSIEISEKTYEYDFSIKFICKKYNTYFYLATFINDLLEIKTQIIELDYKLELEENTEKIEEPKLIEKYIYNDFNCINLRVIKEDEKKYYAIGEKLKDGKINIITDVEIEKNNVIEIDKSHYYASVIFSRNLDELYSNLKYLEKNKININYSAIVDFYENEDYELVITKTDFGNKLLIQLKDVQLNEEDKNKYSFIIKDKLENIIFDIEEQKND